MDYCFTLLLLETVSSTAWARILICLTCNTLNIRSTASNIKLIRLALLRRPLMLLGMKRPITTYSACLALGGGLSVFDRASASRRSSFSNVFHAQQPPPTV